MNRRALILAVAGAALSGSALASPSAETPAEPASFNLTGVGLPIIVGGRVRNYVFAELKLYLGEGQTLDAVRAKEPYLRDALVRAGHRTPFVLADDWNQLDAAALSASLIRSADSLIGKGAIARVEVVSQAARRRTTVRAL
ncbi:hypothetical protein [Brevundimonas naejangsanensis]|uniref:hypothetical protein n=1 Tax=Brevundimonas naejangsanensis TaxID=588932 RepID=UPI001069EAF8|nr:hypothetical protein [Brevundimonas naejangsanensis]QBQ48019.1 hypothetical protein E3U41_04560 [Brevundimonas naejangsanensis]